MIDFNFISYILMFTESEMNSKFNSMFKLNKTCNKEYNNLNSYSSAIIYLHFVEFISKHKINNVANFLDINHVKNICSILSKSILRCKQTFVILSIFIVYSVTLLLNQPLYWRIKKKKLLFKDITLKISLPVCTWCLMFFSSPWYFNARWYQN